MKIKFLMTILTLAFLCAGADDCDNPSSDAIQREQSERILAEGTAQVGMPAIKNFRERKLLKDIIEMRDQSGLSTITYMVTLDGSLVFLCDSIGYGISSATQFTNPMKTTYGTHGDVTTIPQADPNGLFSPDSAEGTWVMCKNPNGPDVKPIFVEPRIITSPFLLN